MKLSEVPVGNEVVILHFENLPLRLLELGILQGQTVSLLKKGWKGDPVLLNVHGKKIAISKELAEKIVVKTQNIVRKG